METLGIALLSIFALVLAYNTYGRLLARKFFELDRNALVPSEELRDDVDYVPTRRSVIFGHHFTSIAGTGPIVGPAIAVFWGWLPALLWVLLGSIFIGAVHDLGALVISLRNRGQTVGEIAGRLISPRARLLFLLILFFALTVVLAIFGLVIAVIFKLYPESVLSVWLAMPIAVGIGFWARNRNHHLLWPSLGALIALYAAVYVGVYYMPIVLPAAWGNPVIFWTIVLMIYCFFASVLPVWMLLQPRDYVNSHQLIVALVLLVAGILVAGLTQKADIVASAPMISDSIPADAPPIWPFLFITIACGACSGFHCLVSSGTTSKQIACETDAQAVGYGGMLLEGALAVLVILCCTAGLGMGVTNKSGELLTNRAAWDFRYNSGNSWNDYQLPQTVGAFVDGGANFLTAIGIPLQLGVGIIAVLVACFAATTLDTATRLQRYVIQELGASLRIAPLTNKYGATGFAVLCGLTVALLPGPKGPASGGLILWPLFGATNQMLAGLALMVTFFYLWRRSKVVAFIALPMILMMIMPAWAMLWQMFNSESGWLWSSDPLQKYVLFGFGAMIMGMQVWMIIEGAIVWRKVHGVLEEQLPPLPKPQPASAT